MVSSHRRCGRALGEICRFSKTYFFCIFEASGINFTHQFRGVTQYSCHMAYLNGFGWLGGGLTISSTRGALYEAEKDLMS